MVDNLGESHVHSDIICVPDNNIKSIFHLHKRTFKLILEKIMLYLYKCDDYHV